MKRAAELELALAPRAEGMTLQRWLCGELRAAILAGRLAPGCRLPSTRDFARQQAISRGTVVAVYDQLIAEGYLSGATGSGTTVAAALPIAAAGTAQPRTSAAPGVARAAAADTAGTDDAAANHPRLSRQGQLLANSPFLSREGMVLGRPFSPNQPDLGAFPHALWQRLTHQQGRGLRPDDMGYGDGAGHLPLRRAIAEHLRYSQRIDCHAGQVMILSSAQQALDLCARLLLDPGDAALVEDPGYPGAARLFELGGARVQGAPVDRLGLCTDALPMAADARLAYVTAAHQSPLGGTLPLERRLALLAWAEAGRRIIIEDDYDGEYRFDGAPLPALKSLDRHDRVIYLGTFSKLLFPALRLAYAVVPEWLAEPFASAISLTVRHAPILPQAVLAAFIGEGHFARHLRQMRRLYGERAACFQHECATQLDGLLTVLPITTGLDATALLPRGSDDRAVAAALGAWGVEARPISFYGMGQPAPPGLVMGFSACNEAAIRRGVATMAPVLESINAAAAGNRGQTTASV
ncbi:PLP-dependent aminotransferase family protein [Azospira sp.]|uniref:MocR-like pyridoxine biosynthesis transcription factor PdxR n=1 Tax=Azospira sp. TaxID=1872671 RepID=UPI00256E7939|nr:PLP-dependent aminotransferase family protein [Azospira sp.]MDK9690183.1 PLP-dependent aminotransferase family protein [Azospira sp.]